MSTKPVLLLFIDWFSPGYKAGGPIVSCINFIQLMKADYSIYVLTSDTDLGDKLPYNNIVSGAWVPSADKDYMIYYTVSAKPVLPQIRKALSAINPSYIYLNHLFSPKFVVYPLWLAWKGVIKAK
ncbi:MAG TPA: hypothetical protein VL307_06425, partial [Chitinophagaceae bacterium]|nr:hypothetical protein [Chitinophagaceae bacterium]